MRNTVENFSPPEDPGGHHTCTTPDVVICPLHGSPNTDDIPRNPVKKQYAFVGL